MPVPVPIRPKKRPQYKPPAPQIVAPPKGVSRPQVPAPAASPVAAPSAVEPHVPYEFGQAPPSAAGNQLRNDAATALSGATGNWRDSVFRAVSRFGSPELINQYRNDPNFAGYNFVNDPNSTWNQLNAMQTRGLQDVMNDAVRGNTAMSSVRLNNEGLVNQDIGFQRSGQLHDFEDALAEYARALAGAQGQYGQDIFNAGMADVNTANSIPPVPMTRPRSASSGGGSSSSPSKKPSTKQQQEAERQKQAAAAEAHAKAEAQAKKKAKKK